MTRRRYRRALISLIASGALALGAGAAQAQQIVFDPKAYAEMIDQAETAMKQLHALQTEVDQGRQLLDSLNAPSGLETLAQILGSAGVRDYLPETASINGEGGLSALGEIGRRAGQIRDGQRLFTPDPADPIGQDLEASGLRAARDLAVGEATARVGAQRSQGLETLIDAIGAAPDARAVLDLQARLAGEQAIIANDQARLQGLAITRQAEADLQVQRDRERAAAARKARMDLLRQGF